MAETGHFIATVGLSTWIYRYLQLAYLHAYMYTLLNMWYIL